MRISLSLVSRVEAHREMKGEFCMVRRDGSTRDHILRVSADYLETNESNTFHVKTIAKMSNVGVPTVYYHFTSRSNLIAAAQSVVYSRMVEALHVLLDVADAALISGDEATFVGAIGENVSTTWSYGSKGSKIVGLLLDIWADKEFRDKFCERLDFELSRWITIIEKAKSVGWIDETLDTRSFLATCLVGSLGQLILSQSTVLNVSPGDIRDFGLKIARRDGSSLNPS